MQEVVLHPQLLIFLKTRTANITAATNAYGINNTLLCRMTEGTPGTQGYGTAANNTAYTDGTNTYQWLSGARNSAYSTSTSTTNQAAISGTINTAYLNSSGNLTSAIGTYNQCFNVSSGTIGDMTGTVNYMTTTAGATGTIGAAYGSNNVIQNNSTVGGSIALARASTSSISKAAAASAIPTAYLYYGEYGAGAATTAWGIYLTGESKNYFSGKVGIGADPGAYKCYINGTGYLNAAAWVYSSDRRLKENIKHIPSGLNIISQLKPATFDYIDGEKKQAGFIAQEVQTVLPDIVSQRPDGMLGMKTDAIIPYLVKAMQEQQSIIDSQQLTIDKMKVDNKITISNQQTEFETRIAKLEASMSLLLQSTIAEIKK